MRKASSAVISALDKSYRMVMTADIYIFGFIINFRSMNKTFDIKF